MEEEFVFLSCLLNSPSLIDRVASKIKPEYFENQAAKKIYETMLELGKFTEADIYNRLKGEVSYKKLAEIGALVTVPATGVLVDGYGYYILESYKRRQVQALLSGGDIGQISAKIEELHNLTFFEEKSVDESEEFLKKVELIATGNNDVRLEKTGFNNFDDAIGGLGKSELIIIGGRPASGKTTFAVNMAHKMSESGKDILFCSLEMNRIELHERIVKSITGIDNYKDMNPADVDAIITTSKKVKEDPLIIYDKAGMTFEDIKAKAKMSKPVAVFIDHLNILKSARHFSRRIEELYYLTSSLKQLARELDIPVVVLCQLNRGVEGRDIKAPMLSDLRDSGSIEQDADIVSFVYRPEYHLKDKEPDDKNSSAWEEWHSQMEEVKGKAQLIIAKNRRGLLCRLKYWFEGRIYRFSERD
jgi:replicative DNA helicase